MRYAIEGSGISVDTDPDVYQILLAFVPLIRQIFANEYIINSEREASTEITPASWAVAFIN
jgi:hypothetical protein